MVLIYLHLVYFLINVGKYTIRGMGMSPRSGPDFVQGGPELIKKFWIGNQRLMPRWGLVFHAKPSRRGCATCGVRTRHENTSGLDGFG